MSNSIKNSDFRTVLRNASDRVFRPHTMVTAGKTPYDVVYDNGLVTLRHYRQPKGQAPQYAVPLVIVPPLAIGMLIYDWFPDRSFVKYMLGKGFDIYMLDWGSPSRKHAHYTLETYVGKLMPEFLAKVREHSGQQQLTLHGWSLGGGMSLCYQAYTQDPDIRNIITLGTAVDGHKNGQVGRQYAALNKALKALKLDFRKVPSHVAYTPGWVNAVLFKMTDPVSTAQGYMDLVRNLGDREYIIQHANQGAFLNNLEAYPGGVIRDWMYSIWLENEASRGYITIGRKKALLKDVTANLLSIAGESDLLSNQYCCKPILDMVSSEDKTFFVGHGGHTGILSGSKAPVQIWPTTAEWLAARS